MWTARESGSYIRFIKFINIYPSCERIVKSPQSSEAVLTITDMYMCAQISSSPATVSGYKIFSPNLPNNLLRIHLALIQIEGKNISSQGVPHVGNKCLCVQWNFTRINYKWNISLQAWTNLGVIQVHLSEHWRKKSSPGGAQLCRFSFCLVRILDWKKHK